MKRLLIPAAVVALFAWGLSCRIAPDQPARPALGVQATAPVRMTGAGTGVPEGVLGWYSGIVERCDMVGIAKPVWSDTFMVPAGEHLDVITWTNVVNGTNEVHSTTNRTPLAEYLTVTNVISGSVAYTVTNDYGAVITGTAVVPMTRSFWLALEAKTEELIPYFVSMRAANESGDLGPWMDTNPALPGDYLPFPRESKAGLFAREGIGTVSTNLTTNSTGWITGGFAAWKAIEPGPLQSQKVVLGELAGDWVFTLAGFPDNRANGRYAWAPAWDWNQVSFRGGAWLNMDRAALYGEDPPALYFGLNTWNVVLFGRTYPGSDAYASYRLPARTVPVGSATSWKNAAGTVVTGAVSFISTNWVYRPVEGSARVPGKSLSGSFYVYYPENYQGDKIVTGRTMAHYTRGNSNALATLSLIVQGYALTNGLTNVVNYPDLLAGGLPPDSETVSLSSEWTPLVKNWIWITNAEITGAVTYGDTVTIVATNLVLSGSGSDRVLDQAIADRTNALAKLKWTAALAYRSAGTDVHSGLYWATGISRGYGVGYVQTTGTWGQAKQVAIDAWASGYLDPDHSAQVADAPRNWASANIYKPYGVESWQAQGDRSVQGMYVSNLTTRTPKAADLYLRFMAYDSDDGTTNYYNPDFPSSSNGAALVVHSWDTNSDAVLTSPVWGSTNAPALADAIWPDQPVLTNTVIKRGYYWDNFHVVVLKWVPAW